MKKIIAALVVGGLASLSQASELWWTVNGSYDSTAATMSTAIDGENVSWNIAKLMANTTGENFNGSELGSISAADLADFTMASSGLDGYGSSAYFYVELYNSENLVGRSYVSLAPAQGGLSYSQLAASIYEDSFSSAGGVSPYAFNSFTTSQVAPEPTSGLLVLLGAMALGLKRKKEIV